MSLLNALAGLAQGFADGQNQRLKDEGNEELKKLQVKMFKRQLEMQDEAQAAKKQLIGALAPIFSTPEPPVEGSQQTSQNLYPQQSGGLKSLLQTPQGQALALKSGIGLGDIKKYQQMDLPEMLARLQTNGAVGNAMGDAPAPGAPAVGGAGRLNFSGLEVDAEGNPKAKFDTSTVKNWAVGPDGKTEIGYDQNGRPIAQRPAGPDKRAEEDKPLGVTGATGMTNAAGISPPPTMTLREATANGFKIKEDKVPLSDSSRISLVNEGMKNLGGILNTIAPPLKNPDGSIVKNDDGTIRREVNKKIIFQMNAPFGGIGQGREIRQMAYTAIAAQLLLQSGVAVRPEEAENMMDAYLPTTLDLTNPGLVERKLQRFENLLQGNIDLASLPPSLRARVMEARKVEPKGGGKNDPLGIR